MVLPLNPAQIKERLQRRERAAAINQAKAHQERLRFHIEPRVQDQQSGYVQHYFKFVGSLIPPHKFETFKNLFRFPTKSSELSQTIFDRLSRVFDGRNPVYNYQFLDPEDRDDWDYYRFSVLREPEIWQTDGWANFKTEINSVLIIDLPEEQAGDKPEPYFYWLPIDKVIDYDLVKNSDIFDWLAFQLPGDRVAVFDATSFRIFEYKNGNLGDQVSEKPHDLGYCPAKFFWNDSISVDRPDIKESPITKVLGSLDWYLFQSTSKKHLDLYGAYPVFSGFTADCDYRDDHGNECSAGYLKRIDGVFLAGSAGGLTRCPKCSTSRMAGAGTFVDIPAPISKDSPDLRNPVQIVPVDRNSLDYNTEEEERLGREIIDRVTGLEGKAMSETAVNELQVNANFENQSTILNRIKKGFEEAQTFVGGTICRLRYGDSFIDCSINLGTEFYILDAQTLREKYDLAKKSGASESELEGIRRQTIETEYRHDKLQLQRMLMLLDLEPLANLTRSEALELANKQLIPRSDFLLKIFFTTFVKRFENENTSILEFGLNLDYGKRLEIIRDQLKSYIDDNQFDTSTDT